MKKRYYITLIIAFWMMGLAVYGNPVQLEVDNQIIQTEVEPFSEKGTTLVPLRVISEALGALVDYVPETQMILILKGTDQILLRIDQPEIVMNKEVSHLEVAPRLVEGTTMVPLRVISESLDCKIEWKNKEKRVVIETKNNPKVRPIATLVIKDRGEVKIELYPATAPLTVANFIHLANSGFYNGLTFHRVINDFMIQGGCPEGTGMGGPGYTIQGEFTENGFVNMLSHTEGVLSMARSVNPNSAGSQFFIMTSASPYLDHQYAAFGKVISGMEIVYGIEGVETNLMDQPVETIEIEKITVDTKGINY